MQKLTIHATKQNFIDESEQISTRSLALTRYKRNHELMNEVFMFAAFGGPAARAAAGTKKLKKRKQKKDGDTEQEGEGEEKLATPYTIFDKNEMEAKMVSSFLFSPQPSYIPPP
jgi:hypothetical protein